KADLVEYSREEPGHIGAAAEPEHVHAVAWLPGVHQVLIGFASLPEDPGAKREADSFRDEFAGCGPRARFWERADAGIVVQPLNGRRPIEDLDQPDDVCVFETELVVRAVEAKHKVLGHVRLET